MPPTLRAFVMLLNALIASVSSLALRMYVISAAQSGRATWPRIADHAASCYILQVLVTGADACTVTCNSGGSPTTTDILAGTENSYAKDRSGAAYTVSSTTPIQRMAGGAHAQASGEIAVICCGCRSKTDIYSSTVPTFFLADLCRRTSTEFGLCDSVGVCEDASGGKTAFDKIEDFFRYVERGVFAQLPRCVWLEEGRVAHVRFLERSSPRIPALALTVISTPKKHWTGSNARMRTSPMELGSALAS